MARPSRSTVGVALLALVMLSLLGTALVAGHRYATLTTGAPGAEFAGRSHAFLPGEYRDASGVVTGAYSTFRIDGAGRITQLDALSPGGPFRLLDAVDAHLANASMTTLGAHELVRSDAASMLVSDAPALTVDVTASAPTTVVLTLPAGASASADGALVRYAGSAVTLRLATQGAIAPSDHALIVTLAKGQALSLAEFKERSSEL